MAMGEFLRELLNVDPPRPYRDMDGLLAAVRCKARILKMERKAELRAVMKLDDILKGEEIIEFFGEDGEVASGQHVELLSFINSKLDQSFLSEVEDSEYLGVKLIQWVKSNIGESAFKKAGSKKGVSNLLRAIYSFISMVRNKEYFMEFMRVMKEINIVMPITFPVDNYDFVVYKFFINSEDDVKKIVKCWNEVFKYDAAMQQDEHDDMGYGEMDMDSEMWASVVVGTYCVDDYDKRCEVINDK
jgi:hypothetical protein